MIMRAFINRIAGDERGTTLIELALATPILASLLIGMIDISRAFSEKLQLEQAAQRSIEKVMNNQLESSTYSALVAEAAEAAGVSPEDVTIDYWLECNSVRQEQYDTNCPDGQVYARFITVAIAKDFDPIFGTQFFPGANADGTFTITAEAGIRTQ